MLAACGDSDKVDEQTPGAPSVKLVDGDIDTVQPILPEMTVKVQVVAPGGISSLVIDIDSPALTPEVLASLGLAARMDLASPASEEMAASLSLLGLPTGAAVKDLKELQIDISRLVPMIATIYPQTSDHDFKLTVRDNYNQQTSGTLKFRLTVEQKEAPSLPSKTGISTPCTRSKRG